MLAKCASSGRPKSAEREDFPISSTHAPDPDRQPFVIIVEATARLRMLIEAPDEETADDIADGRFDELLEILRDRAALPDDQTPGSEFVSYDYEVRPAYFDEVVGPKRFFPEEATFSSCDNCTDETLVVPTRFFRPEDFNDPSLDLPEPPQLPDFFHPATPTTSTVTHGVWPELNALADEIAGVPADNTPTTPTTSTTTEGDTE